MGWMEFEFDDLTEEQIDATALADPDAEPPTPGQLDRARRVLRTALIRAAYGLSQAVSPAVSG